MNAINYFFNHLKSTPCDINEHFDALAEVSKECEVIVEMGIGRIVSTWALLYGRPKKLTSYDIYNPSIHGANIQIVYEACAEEGIKYEFIQKSTLDVVIDPCDLLFIDTLHTYDQLKQELQLHGNKARKYIVFHDTQTFGTHGELPNSKGLVLAIEEFLKMDDSWAIHKVYTHNNGLTILKKNIPT